MRDDLPPGSSHNTMMACSIFGLQHQLMDSSFDTRQEAVLHKAGGHCPVEGMHWQKQGAPNEAVACLCSQVVLSMSM